MELSSHRLQYDRTKCKSQDSSTKYALENESESIIMVLPLEEEEETLSKRGRIHNKIDNDFMFNSPSTVPTCSTSVDPNTILEQENDIKATKSDEKIYDRVLDKLYIAYQNLYPVIDEIINNATECTASDKQPDESIEAALCSVTHEQYVGAIKASRLIQEIRNDVIQNSTIDMELLTGDIHLPATDFIVHSAQQSIYTKLEDTAPDTPAARIYIEKNVVDQLIELYYLLHGALQQLSQITKDKQIPTDNPNSNFYKNSSCVFKLSHSSKNQFKASNSSNTHNPQNDLLLSKLQEEYQGLSDAVDMLKSIVKETSGSIGDLKKLRKCLQAAKKSKSDNSVIEIEKSKKITDASGARRCILECLVELAEVRKYLKDLDNTKETSIASDICLTGEMKRECCSKKNVPHLHAKLNGIPIVVKLNQVLGF